MLLHPGTQEPNGRIRIRLLNAEDAKKLEDAIHAQPVGVGGELMAIQVTNPALQRLPACHHQYQGNGAGIPQSRVGAPPGL